MALATVLLPSTAVCSYSEPCTNPCPRKARRLTLPSRGQTKGYAFCLPLMSNVRPTSVNSKSARCHATRASLRSIHPVGTRVLSPPLGLKSLFARAVRASPASAPLALCRERTTPSRSQSVRLVTHSIQNRALVHPRSGMQENVPSLVHRELSRLGARFCPSTSSARQLVSKRVAARRMWCRPPRPNPAVEGTAKRLRLSSAPHLAR